MHYNILLCEDAEHDGALERGFRTKQSPGWFGKVGAIPRCAACAARHRREMANAAGRRRSADVRARRRKQTREKMRELRDDPNYRAEVNEGRRLAYAADEDLQMMTRLHTALRAWRKKPNYGARVVMGRTFTPEQARAELNRLVRKRKRARDRAFVKDPGPVARIGRKRSGKV